MSTVHPAAAPKYRNSIITKGLGQSTVSTQQTTHTSSLEQTTGGLDYYCYYTRELSEARSESGAGQVGEKAVPPTCVCRGGKREVYTHTRHIARAANGLLYISPSGVLSSTREEPLSWNIQVSSARLFSSHLRLYFSSVK